MLLFGELKFKFGDFFMELHDLPGLGAFSNSEPMEILLRNPVDNWTYFDTLKAV